MKKSPLLFSAFLLSTCLCFHDAKATLKTSTPDHLKNRASPQERVQHALNNCWTLSEEGFLTSPQGQKRNFLEKGVSSSPPLRNAEFLVLEGENVYLPSYFSRLFPAVKIIAPSRERLVELVKEGTNTADFPNNLCIREQTFAKLGKIQKIIWPQTIQLKPFYDQSVFNMSLSLDKIPNLTEIDFSKNCQFNIEKSGKITNFYVDLQNVLNLKKIKFDEKTFEYFLQKRSYDNKFGS